MADEARRAPTVFISYASENREAARRIGASLPAFGLEVWYDESELGGGDAWDQKIRRQIRECDYFMALVSAQTEARREGYFRREWRLAAERTLDMADEHLFLLPVVIDDTDATHARVPEKFQSVQWLRVPGGEPTPALEALCRRLMGGDTAIPPPRASLHPGGIGPGVSQPNTSNVPNPPNPAGPPPQDDKLASFKATPFPQHDSGQSVRFVFEVLGWVLRNAYLLFLRLPKWIRILIILWAITVLVSRCNSGHREDTPAAKLSQEKIDAIAKQYQNNPGELSKLGAQVAKEFGKELRDDGVTLLAVPFTAPSGDAAVKTLIDMAFAQTYTRLSVARHSQLSVNDGDVPGCELKALVKRGHSKDTDFVLCGTVETGASAPAALSVTLVDVDHARENWHGNFPVAGADPAAIAQEIATHVPDSPPDD